MRTVHFAWEAPTTRNGGASVGPDDIQGYELQLSPVGEATIGFDLPAAPRNFDTNLENGDYSARIRAIDSSDQPGLWTILVEFMVHDVVVPPLSPPDAFTVTIL